MAGSFADALIRIRGDTSSVDRALRRTHGRLRGLASPLRRIRDIAGGILLARAFQMGVQAISAFARKAIWATETMQLLDLQIQSLVAREMSQFINTAIEMSGAITYTSKGTENWYIITKALRENLGDYVDILPQVSDKLMEVAASQRHGVRVTKEQGEAWVTGTQMYDLAAERAEQVGFQLKKLGVLSPYSIQAANDVMRLSLAFGFTTDQSLRMTAGMLDLAAGLGATGEMLNRMTFNFAQLRKQGKMQARDFWELGKAGFDLYAVLRKLASQTGLNIKTHHDFNRMMASGKINWEDFVTAFETMAKEDFGGAAKRMAYSITGLKSMFQDMFLVTIPEILKPTAQFIGEWAEGASEKLLILIESGAMERTGEKVREFVEDIIGFFQQVGRMMDLQGFAGIIQTLMNLGLIDYSKGKELKPYADGIQRVWDALKNFFGVTWSTIREGLVGFLTAFVGADAEKLNNITWHDVLDTIADFVENLGRVIGNEKDGIVEGLTLIAPSIRGFVDSIGNLGGALLDIGIGILQELFAIFKREDPVTISDAATSIDTISESINNIATFLRENKGELVETLTNVVIAFAAFKTIMGIQAIISGLAASISLLGASTGPVYLLAVALSVLIALFIEHRSAIADFFSGWDKTDISDLEFAPVMGPGLIDTGSINEALQGEVFEVPVMPVAGPGGLAVSSAFADVGANAAEELSSTMTETIFGEGAKLGIQVETHGEAIGGSMVEGIIHGVRNDQFALNKMMRDMAREALKAAEEELQIHSPSQVFEGIGENVVSGFVGGISGTLGYVQDAVGDLASTATQTPRGARTVGKGGTTSTDKSRHTHINEGALNVTVGKEEDIFAATMAFEDALLNTLEEVN